MYFYLLYYKYYFLYMFKIRLAEKKNNFKHYFYYKKFFHI